MLSHLGLNTTSAAVALAKWKSKSFHPSIESSVIHRPLKRRG